MPKQPKMVFKNLADMEKCMEEWKEILMLHDWIIECRLVKELYNEGEECWGLNSHELVGRTSTISVRQYDPDKDNTSVEKYCAEYILIHELLHLVYPVFTKDSYEANYFGTMEHRKLDKMAQSFIMAKYNLNFNWFKNKKD